MTRQIQTYLLLAGIAMALFALWVSISAYHLPDNQQDYQPRQPIAFSHRLHAGELAIDCMYCHSAADKSRHAGIPAGSTCMNCHSLVTSSWGAVQAEDEAAEQEQREAQRIISQQLAKLYNAMGLNDKLEPDPAIKPTSIPWIQVHNLPEFVYFDHRAHLNVGVHCQTCHGNVETMEQVRQVKSLSMGWCVNCHREANRIGVQGKPVHASIDCTTCHY